jgi:hypothetical protein
LQPLIDSTGEVHTSECISSRGKFDTQLEIEKDSCRCEPDMAHIKILVVVNQTQTTENDVTNVGIQKKMDDRVDYAKLKLEL